MKSVKRTGPRFCKTMTALTTKTAGSTHPIGANNSAATKGPLTLSDAASGCAPV